MKLLRYGVSGLLIGASQLAQWFCLLMTAVVPILGIHAASEGNWTTVWASALSFILWGVGALLFGMILHWCAYLIPD